MEFWCDQRKNSICSLEIIGINLFSMADDELYERKLIGKLEEITSELKTYKWYILIGICIENPTRIDDYKKLWKKIKENHKLYGFKLGKEYKYTNHHSVLYYGVASIDLKDLPAALEIMRDDSYDSLLIMSEKEEEIIEGIISDVFKSQELFEGNYLEKIGGKLILSHNLILQWVNRIEEVQMNVHFNTEVCNLLGNISLQ